MQKQKLKERDMIERYHIKVQRKWKQKTKETI